MGSDPKTRKEIYMFPNAGGTIRLFKDIIPLLENDFLCFPFEYPGHGYKADEPLCPTIEKLSKKALEFIMENHNCESELYLFGYSMGSLLCMELLNYLEKLIYCYPVKVVLAASAPKQDIIENNSFSERQNMQEFYMKNGSISKRIIESKIFQTMYYPSFMNDYQMMKTYDYRVLQQKNGVRCMVLFSSNDLQRDIVEKWNDYFLDPPFFIQFSGNHFFISDNNELIAKSIIDFANDTLEYHES